VQKRGKRWRAKRKDKLRKERSEGKKILKI
jgi:hypothetical protein